MIQIRKLQIPALPTQKDRRLYVYLPRDYEASDRRYPVLYMFDGHNVFYDSHATYGKSWGMKQYLERTKLPLIVAAVACNTEGNRRLSEYAPYDFSCKEFGRIAGCGKLTMDWFTQALKPEIDRDFRTLPDREHTMICGSSMGGLMAVYAAVAYNDIFSRAAGLSPCLWFGQRQLQALYRSTPLRKPTRIWLDVGGGEAELTQARDRVFRCLFTAANALSRAGADVTMYTAPGAMHCEAAWERRIPAFLPWLTDGMEM